MLPREFLPTTEACVEPEGGCGAGHHRHPRNSAVKGEAHRNDPLEERRGGGEVSQVATCMGKEPILPWKGVSLVEFVCSWQHGSDVVDRSAKTTPGSRNYLRVKRGRYRYFKVAVQTF